MSLAEALRRRVPERWARRWPTIRAALVTYHALAVVLVAFPSPPPNNMSRASWENPTVQNELKQWAERLRGAGVDITTEQLDARLYALAKRYLAVRERVIAPFEPYGTYLGARQNWQLFVAPQRYPVKLEVSVREGGAWRTVYASRSSEHTWRADLFEHYRMRRVLLFITWEGDRDFKSFCDFVAARAAEDFPGATDVMIDKIRYRTPTPEEALAGVETPESKRIGREQRRLGAKR